MTGSIMTIITDMFDTTAGLVPALAGVIFINSFVRKLQGVRNIEVSQSTREELSPV